ncbi:MAG TPA: hypothetical protein VE732_04290 [Nitrososphaera sp.]|jgi:hypothetical protein|nr:hypothetical protein [Nitrososphaera sp.]
MLEAYGARENLSGGQDSVHEPEPDEECQIRTQFMSTAHFSSKKEAESNQQEANYSTAEYARLKGKTFSSSAFLNSL